MPDKHRHRHLAVPHGSAPNWLLLVMGACTIAITVLAGSFV